MPKKKVSKLDSHRKLTFFATADDKMKSTKALEDGSVYFEGWANKAIVDRGGDLITKGEWILDDYKKNAVILFNHDHEQPVGKGVEIEARDEGLYVKARIANSSDPQISRVRDLVKEGVLNSLSVGIYVGDEERTEKGNILKKVQLHEISIVAVPMNQDSQFTLSAKSLGKSMYSSLKAVAAGSGHEDVAKALEHIEAEGLDAKSVEDLAETLATESGVEKSEALEFLKLNNPDTPQAITDWMVKTEMAEKTKGMENVALQSVKIPKAVAATMDDVSALAEGSGWDLSNVEETEDAFVLVQLPADQFEGELRELPVGNGIIAYLGEKISGEVEEPESETPAAEPSLEAKDEESEKDKGLLDEQGLAAVPVAEGIPPSQDANPTMDQAKQTNVLLASVVSLLQQMSQKLDTLAGKPNSEPEVAIAPEPVPVKSVDEMDAVVKMVKDFEAKTASRLDALLRNI